MLKYFLIIFLGACVLGGCGVAPKDERLPILGRTDVVQKKVNGEVIKDTVYHTIDNFKFLNQDSIWVTQDTFKDRIYIADFFFTTCNTICPLMKAQMVRLYNEFDGDDNIAFLSHTIDPDHDTVSVLRDYAQRLGADSKRWHFVTGDIDTIHNHAQKSYYVTALEDKTQPDGFVHSGAFVLVDKKLRIRGLYDGTKAESVDQLILDVPKLLAENQMGL